MKKKHKGHIQGHKVHHGPVMKKMMGDGRVAPGMSLTHALNSGGMAAEAGEHEGYDTGPQGSGGLGRKAAGRDPFQQVSFGPAINSGGMSAQEGSHGV